MKPSILTLCLALPFLMAVDECGYHGGGQGYSDDAGNNSFDLMQYPPGCDNLRLLVDGCFTDNSGDFQGGTVRECALGKLQAAETGERNGTWRPGTMTRYQKKEAKMDEWIKINYLASCRSAQGTVFDGLHDVPIFIGTECGTPADQSNCGAYAQVEINDCILH